jgi:TonB family protein
VDNVVFSVDKRGGTKAGYRIETPSASIVLKSMRPPRYPADLMRAGISGTVLVAFRIGLDGRVAEAATVQSMLFDVRGRDRVMQQIVRQFEMVAVGAVKGWTFEVASKATPSSREMTQYVPIEFLMQGVAGDPKPGLWRTVVRSAAKAPAWLPPAGRATVGVADLAGGRMLTPDARVVLTTEVVGTDLM